MKKRNLKSLISGDFIAGIGVAAMLVFVGWFCYDELFTESEAKELKCIGCAKGDVQGQIVSPKVDYAISVSDSISQSKKQTTYECLKNLDGSVYGVVFYEGDEGADENAEPVTTACIVKDEKGSIMDIQFVTVDVKNRTASIKTVPVKQESVETE